MKTIRIGKKEFTVFNEKEMEIVKRMVINLVIDLDEQIEHNQLLLKQCVDDKDALGHTAIWNLNIRLEERRNEYRLFLTHIFKSS